MAINIKGVVRYDGTDFCGWQRQDGPRTVQGELEACLSRIANQPVSIQGAGRTDTGILTDFFTALYDGWAEDQRPKWALLEGPHGSIYPDDMLGRLRRRHEGVRHASGAR